jgi:hypothetical protein
MHRLVGRLLYLDMEQQGRESPLSLLTQLRLSLLALVVLSLPALAAVTPLVAVVAAPWLRQPQHQDLSTLTPGLVLILAIRINYDSYS